MHAGTAQKRYPAPKADMNESSRFQSTFGRRRNPCTSMILGNPIEPATSFESDDSTIWGDMKVLPGDAPFELSEDPLLRPNDLQESSAGVTPSGTNAARLRFSRLCTLFPPTYRL